MPSCAKCMMRFRLEAAGFRSDKAAPKPVQRPKPKPEYVPPATADGYAPAASDYMPWASSTSSSARDCALLR